MPSSRSSLSLPTPLIDAAYEAVRFDEDWAINSRRGSSICTATCRKLPQNIVCSLTVPRPETLMKSRTDHQRVMCEPVSRSAPIGTPPLRDARGGREMDSNHRSLSRGMPGYIAEGEFGGSTGQ